MYVHSFLDSVLYSRSLLFILYVVVCICQSQPPTLPLHLFLLESSCWEILYVAVVQSLSHVWLFETPWTATHQVSLSFVLSWSCSVSCPPSWWCYPIISSSVCLFSSCPKSFPALGSFPLSWLFTSDGQNIGASASASAFIPSNEYSGLISYKMDWFDLLAVQYWQYYML